MNRRAKSDELRREYEAVGIPYPGDRAAARRQLQLARECIARARELDPSLRPATAKTASLAMDSATENRIIERAIQTARRQSTTSRPRRNPMPSNSGFLDALFQGIRPNRDGEAFAAAWDERFTRRRVKAHALDAAPDCDAALKELGHAKDHLDAVKDGAVEYDQKHLVRMLLAVIRAMGAEEDAQDDEPRRTREDDMTAHERDRVQSGKDGTGETPARSVVSLKGDRELGEPSAGAAVVTLKGARRYVDHRKDFDDLPQGGPPDPASDSALAFDSDGLFQRDMR